VLPKSGDVLRVTKKASVQFLEPMLFRVIRCEAVLPDGLILRFPEDAEIAERSFQDEFPPGGAQTTKGPGNLEIPARIHRNDEPDDRLAQVPAAGELTQT